MTEEKLTEAKRMKEKKNSLKQQSGLFDHPFM